MNRFKFGAMFVCIALVVLAFSSGARADDWNKASLVTFAEPIEVPGEGAQVLPPGTYVFKLLDHQSDRSVVQIWNERGDHLFSTILAIPNFRVRTTTKTVTTYTDRGYGQAQALKAWFYPGLQWGWEFVYPKTRALELAKLTNGPVLAMPAELASTLVAPIKSADEPQVAALKSAKVEAIKPTGEAVAMTEFVEPPPVETAEGSRNEAAEPMPAETAAGTRTEAAEPTPVEKAAGARTEAAEPQPVKTAEVRSTKSNNSLPKTASPIPLLGLIGFLSIATGLGLSGISKPRF